jgi:hypothetical protein
MKAGRDLHQEQRPEVIGGQNFDYEVDDESIYRAMEEMEASRERDEGPPYQGGRPIENRCHHMSLNWPVGHNPSNEHMTETARDALKALGLERAKSVFVRHRDTDNHHAHVVSSRIDPATGRIFPAENQHPWQRILAIQEWRRGYEQKHEQGHEHSWDNQKDQTRALQDELKQGPEPPLEQRLDRAQEMASALAIKRQEVAAQLDMAEQRMAKLDAKQQHEPIAHKAKNEMEMSQ